MRKFLPLLFLLLFFVSQIGYRDFYITRLHQIKESAERQMLQSKPDFFMVSEKCIAFKRDVKQFCNHFNSPVIVSIVREINTPPPRLTS